MSESTGPLVNIEKFNLPKIDLEPASSFGKFALAKICKAAGYLWWTPERQMAHAKARAEVRMIETQAEIKQQIARVEGSAQVELAKRLQEALIHRAYEDIRSAENSKSITAKLLGLLPDERPTDDEPSDDTINHVFRHGQHVSDEQMQSLWANLLAGEFCKPGSFSKKTINLVAELEPKDANDFANLCRFVWLIDVPTPKIHGLQSEFQQSHGINHEFLQNLDNLGLISFTPNHVNNLNFGEASEKPMNVEISYFGEPFHFPQVDSHIVTGCVRFTKAGHELYSICKVDPIPEMIDVHLRYQEKVKKPMFPGKGTSRPTDYKFIFRLDT